MSDGAVREVVGIRCGAISGNMKVSFQAARSIGRSMGFVASVCQPSTLRMLIWPEARSAQNNIAAVSADGNTVCVLIRRLNSSCNRSIAFVVRTLRHWLGGKHTLSTAGAASQVSMS